jgi:SEC-C motif
MAAIPVVCQQCKRLWVTTNFIGGTGNVRITMIDNTVSPCPYCGGTGKVPNGVYELANGVVRYLASGAVSVADLRRLQDVLRDAQQQHARPAQVVQEIKRKVPSAEGITASFGSQASIALAAWLTVLIGLITLILMTRTQSGGTSLTQTQVEQAVEQALKDAHVGGQQASDPSASPSVAASPSARPTGKVGWNHHCPCGSRRKYKKCCGRELYGGE